MNTAWISGNFKEILPDRLSAYTESLVPELFNRAFTELYVAYGYKIPRQQLSVAKIFEGRAYFNGSLLIELAERYWGVDGRIVIHSMGGRIPDGYPYKDGCHIQQNVVVRLRRVMRVLVVACKAIVNLRIWNTLEREPTSVAEMTQQKGVEFLNAMRIKQEALLCKVLRNHLAIGILSSAATDKAMSFFAKSNPHVPASDVHAYLVGQSNAPSIQQQKDWEALIRQYSAVEGCVFATKRFETAFQSYLEQYGNRGVFEMEVALPRMKEQPERLLKLIYESAEKVKQSSCLSKQDGVAIISDIEGRNKQTLLIAFAVSIARKVISIREQSKARLAIQVAELRAIMLLLGTQLSCDGLLCESSDIFYLRREEIDNLVTGDMTSARVLIHARECREVTKLPDEFWTQGNGGRVVSETLSEDKSRLTGIAVSTGNIIGTARIVQDPEALSGFNKGDIAICRSLDAGWNALYSLAGGVVTEVGGVVSHAAILLREQGIPAIFNVRNASHYIHDGDIIEVNTPTNSVCIITTCTQSH